METNILTQADIQAYAPTLDLSAYSSTTVSGMISRAQARAAEYASVDGFTSAVVTAETDRARINQNGDLVISVRRPPLQSVTAIRLKGTNVNVPLTLADSAGSPYYFISGSKASALLYYPSNFLIANGIGLVGLRSARLFYEIDYVGGFNTAPETLKEAISLLVQDQASRAVNINGVQSFSQGKFSMSFGNSGKSSHLTAAEGILSRGGYIRRVI